MMAIDDGYIDVAAGFTFLGLSSQSGFDSASAGTAWAPSLGLRFQRPRETAGMRLDRSNEALFGVRPWLDADALYVRTGILDRFGFAAAAGLSFPLDDARTLWLGPFVRYLQIVQANHTGYDTGDAHTLIIGLSFEVGTRLSRPVPVTPAPLCPVALAAQCPVAVAVVARPDRDGDGVPDDIDQCPDVPGPASNNGCPIYEKVVVKPDRLELREKIQFAWNSGELDPVSYPLLDEVAKALQDNKGFRVAIEGNASSEGGDEHNQVLSARRGQSVLDYLARRGIARDRLVSHGFGSSRPIESNSTESGREANRRVDFVVHFIILKEESPR